MPATRTSARYMARRLANGRWRSSAWTGWSTAIAVSISRRARGADGDEAHRRPCERPGGGRDHDAGGPGRRRAEHPAQRPRARRRGAHGRADHEWGAPAAGYADDRLGALRRESRDPAPDHAPARARA